ncbi:MULTISPECIES: DUF4176 domain-containing protein [Pontibacillus]|uniref:DUF4176 domain-containing protein n=1 Tax=Pontibacillus chungwhensis TaxID=265426 RepID=A0ABY8UVP5_9BACI|nr:MULTISPECIES: DUF4176 domain-containing protein [Pontibacillus]MCD5324196.1 DUF4176 domain-containing protein [Pontibacillus sp. HN14]WIF97746.1 DUF4176 domain-containing protein [Pontibacillus chungwhensis]
MHEEILPIGSIVKLEGGNKKLMIYGRKQRMKNSGEVFDYLGCPYPEGYISLEYSFVFNHVQIKEIVFRGLINGEEEEFVSNVLSQVEDEGSSEPVPKKKGFSEKSFI